MSFERVHENDGVVELDPLVGLVHQKFSVFVDICVSCHRYSVGTFFVYRLFVCMWVCLLEN